MSLTLDVFNSGYVPVNGGPGWESARTATWPASTATLIAGERLVALNTAVVDAARMHVVDPIRQNWIEWFGDEFNHQAAVPQALGSETLTVEEHPVHLIEVGVPMVHWPRCCTSPNWTPFAPATRSTTTSTCGCGTRYRRAAKSGCRPPTRLPT